ncbi:glycoside hydrolase family 17 protein [Eremomyces bilateralis CBS 781.70]|uniref:Probable glucan endo-1,3-beta-glucosidase eglC n=1 Tax=Eremomyces bilateralis CBS 781.70 TaxID=1392243 RepID=A0A6G1GEK4_9PEZI|nr:glycoside hydrolase family 17 protein [Eremomyces bilateralis CBS 781.70]KAF1816483.1 glycoside hydrolase family 17 protein [Eremomyces bilateralis CBS 781.70]
MRLPALTTTALLALSHLSLAEAYWKGFNVGANNPDGTCKTRDDWAHAFTQLASLPGHFTTVRTFATSDCDTLANAVPAALDTGTQLLVGVWTQDDAHFEREKVALEAAIREFGDEWIVAIMVGNEDLYRGEVTAEVLAGKIYDVRGMVRALGVEKEVGHADTWTAWVDGANEAVIQASDFVAHQGYPYWQGADIANSASVYWASVQATRDVVNAVKPGTWVWMTETGWPVTGDDFGAAQASVWNAQEYWKQVACEAFNEGHTFWYAYQDYTSTPSFGVIGQDGNPLYDLTC